MIQGLWHLCMLVLLLSYDWHSSCCINRGIIVLQTKREKTKQLIKISAVVECNCLVNTGIIHELSTHLLAFFCSCNVALAACSAFCACCNLFGVLPKSSRNSTFLCANSTRCSASKSSLSITPSNI